MENLVIPKEDTQKIKEVIEKVKEFKENHKGLKPSLSEATDQLQRIHTILYLEMTRDLLKSAGTLEHLLECSKEEFIAYITNDGAHSIDEVETNLMLSIMLEMATNK